MAVRPRVGLLVPRFTVFDQLLGSERVTRLRARRELLARTLEPFADVVATVSVEDEGDATRARQAFHEARIELVVVAPAMAAPPSLGAAVLAPPSWPAVIWNAIGIDALASDADQPSAVEHTTTVGCQMLAGALARIGAEVPVVSTGPDDAQGIAQLRRVIEAVSLAGALRGRSFVRIGQPPVGYLNVECDADDLALLGARLVDVEQPELEEAFDASTAEDAGAVLAALAELGVRRPGGLEPAPSARLAYAIGTLLDRHDAIAASTNCLGPAPARERAHRHPRLPRRGARDGTRPARLVHGRHPCRPRALARAPPDRRRAVHRVVPLAARRRRCAPALVRPRRPRLRTRRAAHRCTRSRPFPASAATRAVSASRRARARRP